MNIIIGFETGVSRGSPYPSDPFQILTDSENPHICIADLGKPTFEVARLPLGVGTTNSLLAMGPFLDQWRDSQGGILEATRQDVIYSVHTKSVLLRLLGRWAVLRGAPNCELINPSIGAPVFQDLCELFNYPAVLTKEERYSFSPSHIAKVLNIHAGSSTEAAWNLAKRFIN